MTKCFGDGGEEAFNQDHKIQITIAAFKQDFFLNSNKMVVFVFVARRHRFRDMGLDEGEGSKEEDKKITRMIRSRGMIERGI